MFTPGLSGDRAIAAAAGSIMDRLGLAAAPVKAMALANVEMTTLMSRRAQAYLELPKAIARCRSGQDVMREQMLFWQTAWEQYQDSSTRLATAWTQALMPAALGTSSRESELAAREQSPIKLPEAGPKSTETSRRRPRAYEAA
ncbi:MAG: hypothetical protein NW216_11855 [Hyphomicrobium sp.]|nr:hypothetical protein [Hyphomicrobium sp.]